ncbi:hypothetical protein J0895_09130 [Phormidium pseudopriestleyi FRX01]|uniref:Uncharacterized protein n=1 Tax=Phormidium pseudopriestleyi FRX01 TaxID=1759528 RepID=A0ABS3FQ73_9CYAN|nr:hypothetical protein [Phormidium pseudopriestleyi]MBO0349264.1 hypothetical protein [Phormidium pseudopriestleyi FRX01]
MTSTATLYTDEDISALVATLLKARGLDITTVPAQGAIGRTDDAFDALEPETSDWDEEDEVILDRIPRPLQKLPQS